MRKLRAIPMSSPMALSSKTTTTHTIVIIKSSLRSCRQHFTIYLIGAMRIAETTRIDAMIARGQNWKACRAKEIIIKKKIPLRNCDRLDVAWDCTLTAVRTITAEHGMIPNNPPKIFVIARLNISLSCLYFGFRSNSSF